MKKILLLLLLLSFFLSQRALAEEESKSIIFGSIGHSSKDKSTTGRIGGLGKNFGVSIGYSASADYSSDDVHDYPVPHSSYVNLGKKQLDGKYGLDIYACINPTNWSKIALGGGAYFHEEAEIARSTATNWLYKQSSSTKMKLSGSADIFLIFDHLTIGIGYHSILGVLGSVGYAF